MSVLRDWPTYLLKNIPPEIRTEIEREADPHNGRPEQSLAEVVRSILCAHYKLDCAPVHKRNRFEVIGGTTTMLLRLQPELWERIQKEARRRSSPKRQVSTRQVIIEKLEKHYS